MRLTRAWYLFLRPSKAVNDWERIEANLTVSFGNLLVVVACLTIQLGRELWRVVAD